MCVAQSLNEATSQIRGVRDNVNSLFGWGNTETRGEGQKLQSPNVTVYNQLPGGDIAKADTNKSALKLGKK